MDKSKTLHVTSRAEWRAWLSEHYRSEKEVWLVFYKKHTGKPRVSYNDAVEEALCFGWIDSTANTIDADRYMQRFSPRRPKSSYSQANRERLSALIKQGKVVQDVLAALPDAAKSKSKVKVEGESWTDFDPPADIIEAIKASPEAWKNFQGFSPSYIRIRLAYIDDVRRRPEEFAKRLRNFVKMTEKGKQIGFGGIDKYY